MNPFVTVAKTNLNAFSQDYQKLVLDFSPTTLWCKWKSKRGGKRPDLLNKRQYFVLQLLT
jgi:hypothetical protein